MLPGALQEGDILMVDDCCRAGDNWESTYIFWPVYFNFITSALIFGFGAEFRRPVLTNWPLTMSWAALFALGSYLLLADSNAVTRVFHVASEQFNYPGMSQLASCTSAMIWKNSTHCDSIDQ